MDTMGDTAIIEKGSEGEKPRMRGMTEAANCEYERRKGTDLSHATGPLVPPKGRERKRRNLAFGLLAALCSLFLFAQPDGRFRRRLGHGRSRGGRSHGFPGYHGSEAALGQQDRCRIFLSRRFPALTLFRSINFPSRRQNILRKARFPAEKSCAEAHILRKAFPPETNPSACASTRSCTGARASASACPCTCPDTNDSGRGQCHEA